MPDILMPALSPTMTEGTLARWLKHEGDRVSAGDVIAEIETDKATMEVEAVDDGVLRRILVPDGTEGVKVNEPIAVLDADDAEDEDAGGGGAAVPAPAGPAFMPAPAPAEKQDRIVASPAARRVAREGGVALEGIKGSGPDGRIIRADVEARRPAAPASDAQRPVGQRPGGQRIEALGTARRVIARRMAEAKQTIPHFYLTADLCLDPLLALRAGLNALSGKDGRESFRLSVNDLLIKAAALALRRVPALNASYSDDGIVFYEDVDVSVAVSIPDGLMTPIVRRADAKGLLAISAHMRELAERAKAGRLRPEEFQGGGFTVSNLGMYGVRAFSAIINPPQAAVLAVGAAEQRPVVRDGAVAVATIMTCTLSVDHRAVDGARGAEWLAAFRSIVEEPLGLVL